MKTKLLVISAVASIVAAGTAYAAPATGTAAAEQKTLARARDQVSIEAKLTKGAAQQSFDLERRRLDRLIDEIEAGRSVPPSEIERALRDAERTP